MILTVTMNPSVDISYPMEHLKLDTVNRVSSVSKTAGGKGLNVTRVLKLLGNDPIATGVVGGYLGESIQAKLNEEDIHHQFSIISGETRNSIAILHDDGKQTEILESGPTLTEKDQESFLLLFQQLIKKVDLITISGSLPNGLTEDFYCELLDCAKTQKLPVFLDTSNRYLSNALNHSNKPTLIKPNLEELNDLLQTSYQADETEKIKNLLLCPLFQDIPYVIITLGKLGAIAKLQNEVYQATIPVIQAKNPVGSGDATIAGLAHAYHQKKSPEEMLKTGMTTGILNALEPETGKINPQYFEEIYNQVKCEKL